eukprot:NODE_1058_length_683_cov_800.665615_g825_i0.p1 GENE.NODE_1058_length_683_cov_800.665615_g825_i0~~NODE_1058_length_683_cov_800.665615_g825_i0.p1  ORF type:complete len:101 (-),score=4.19 NODE_1058_length_683_cov_800.665615_g825_i0:244-546(-)
MICARLVSVLVAAAFGLATAVALDLPYHDSAYDYDHKRDPAVFPQHSPGNGYEYYSSYGFGYGYMTSATPCPQSTRASSAPVAGITGLAHDRLRPRARFD